MVYLGNSSDHTCLSAPWLSGKVELRYEAEGPPITFLRYRASCAKRENTLFAFLRWEALKIPNVIFAVFCSPPPPNAPTAFPSFHFAAFISFSPKKVDEKKQKGGKSTQQAEKHFSARIFQMLLCSLCVCECGGRKTKANIDFSPVYFHQHIKFYE